MIILSHFIPKTLVISKWLVLEIILGVHSACNPPLSKDSYNLNIIPSMSLFVDISHGMLNYSLKYFRYLSELKVTESLLWFPGVVPYRGYDGAWLRPDWRDCALFHGLRGRSRSLTEDCRNICAVFRAAFLPTPLRLWYASCQVCVDGGWQPQTEVSRAGWICAAPESYQWC